MRRLSLSLLILLSSSLAAALPLENCLTTTLVALVSRGTVPSARADRIAHGGYHLRKLARSMIATARRSDHGLKHQRARTAQDALRMSHETAQYLPSLNPAGLERHALSSEAAEWIPHDRTTMFSFVRFDETIGFDQGLPTRWIRVELSSGTFHGHPISLYRVRKYLPKASP